MSKIVRSEMGRMKFRRIRHSMKWVVVVPALAHPALATRPSAAPNITTNKPLVVLLRALSNLPNLEGYLRPLSFALVSMPVYTTMA